LLDGDTAPPPQKKGSTAPNLPPMSVVAKQLCASGYHLVLDVDPPPLPSRDTAPQFSAHVRCGQTAGWTKMPLGMEVGLSPGEFVLDGTQLPLEKRARPPISVHVYCGQMAGWMKTPPGAPRPRPHCVRRRPSSPARGAQQHPAPLFGPCLLWPRSPISATVELLFNLLS